MAVKESVEDSAAMEAEEAAKKAAKKAKKKAEKKAEKKAKKKAEKKAKKKAAKKAKKKAEKKAEKIASTKKSEINSSPLEIIPITLSTRSVPFHASQEVTNQHGTAQSQKSSSRAVLAVIIGAIFIAILIVAGSQFTSKTPKPATPSVSPTAVESPSASSSPTEATTAPTSPSSAAPTPTSPTKSAPSTPTARDLPPVGIAAYFNSTGATIIWKADTNASRIMAYIIEISSNGGAFKILARVPATHHSLDVIETDTNGWSSFRVSAVFSDGAIVAGKAIGIPSQYS